MYVLDAGHVLAFYCGSCAAAGLPEPDIIAA